MRTNALTSETPFRRASIRTMVDQVEVDDEEIRIIGPCLSASSWAAGQFRPECPVLLLRKSETEPIQAGHPPTIYGSPRRMLARLLR
jgi:hypothetical protein